MYCEYILRAKLIMRAVHYTTPNRVCESRYLAHRLSLCCTDTLYHYQSYFKYYIHCNHTIVTLVAK